MLLVSFCNSKNRNKSSNLALVSTYDWSYRYLKTESHEINGITGLFQNEGLAFSISSYNNKSFLTIRSLENLAVIKVFELSGVKDPHSIVVYNRTLFVVSTGTDSVLAFKLFLDDKLNVFKISTSQDIWKASSTNSDLNHLNGLYHYRNSLYVSGFGKKKGVRWSTATNGFVFNITKEKTKYSKIYHPHSITNFNGDFFYCESSSCSIYKNGKLFYCHTDGYLRGLTKVGDLLVFGISNSRIKSRHSKEYYNPADPGKLLKRCSLNILDTTSKSLKISIDFAEHAEEIYDIISW